MDEISLQNIAEQLRQPQGEEAEKVGELMNKGNLLINQYTLEALELSKGDNILEIGMGNGHFVKDILSAAEEIKYTGCDISKSMVAAASKRNKEFLSNSSATFQHANAEHLPYSKNQFTTVFTIHTIYFWENTEAVLSEIFRVLKPGGRVFISLRPKSIMEGYPFVKYGFNLFSKENVFKLLSENGFTELNCIEKKEPDVDFQGMTLKVETLIVMAQKPTN